MPVLGKNRLSFASTAAAATFALILLFTLIAKSNLSQELEISRQSSKQMRTGKDNILQSNTALNQKIDRLTLELDTAKVRAGVLFQENLQARKEISALTGRMEEMEVHSSNRDGELNEFKRQLVALKTSAPEPFEQSLRKEAAEQITDLNEEIHRLKADLRAYQNRSSHPLSNYSNSKNLISKGDRFLGHILGVDPNNSVLAISMGGDNGAAKSMKLQVVDGSANLAQIIISRVEPQFSVGYVVPGSEPDRSHQFFKGEKVSFIIQ